MLLSMNYSLTTALTLVELQDLQQLYATVCIIFFLQYNGNDVKT